MRSAEPENKIIHFQPRKRHIRSFDTFCWQFLSQNFISKKYGKIIIHDQPQYLYVQVYMHMCVRVWKRCIVCHFTCWRYCGYMDHPWNMWECAHLHLYCSYSLYTHNSFILLLCLKYYFGSRRVWLMIPDLFAMVCDCISHTTTSIIAYGASTTSSKNNTYSYFSTIRPTHKIVYPYSLT